MKENKVALVVVDPQIDFFPGGALGAPKAGQIIKPVNTLLNKGRKNSWGIFISRELHDLQTKEHFNVHGTHCVIGSPGAEIHPEINTQGAVFINKGTGPDDHYYSSLKGKDEKGKTLEELLAEFGIVAVMGLVLEYCVGDTAIDIKKLGKETIIINDATAPLTDKDKEKRSELRKMGIMILSMKTFLKRYC